MNTSTIPHSHSSSIPPHSFLIRFFRITKLVPEGEIDPLANHPMRVCLITIHLLLIYLLSAINNCKWIYSFLRRSEERILFILPHLDP